MKMHKILTAMLLACLLLPAAAHADDMSNLKQRFKERYPVLLKLREAGTVGEMYNGLTDAVDKESLTDKIEEKGRDEPRTLKEFLKAENDDRIQLYKLIAEETKTSVETVAKHNAARNFEKAKKDEFLKPSKEAAWVRKKDMK